METTANHFHISRDITKEFNKLLAGDDAKKAKWLTLTGKNELYASHKAIINHLLESLIKSGEIVQTAEGFKCSDKMK